MRSLVAAACTGLVVAACGAASTRLSSTASTHAPKRQSDGGEATSSTSSRTVPVSARAAASKNPPSAGLSEAGKTIESARALTSKGSATVPAGGTLWLGGAGFGRGSLVQIVLAGKPPRRLAVLKASSSGAVSGTVRIPIDTPAGRQELYAVGYTPIKSLHELGGTVTVTRSGPLAAPSVCVGTLRGTFQSLTIARGTVCTLIKATVNGTITVARGGIFDAESSTINGDVTAKSPKVFQLCADHVRGNVSVASPTLPPLIGGANSPSCAPTRISGTTTVRP
jgi:hypothetical protein